MTAKQKFKLTTQYRKMLADTITPVNIYLKIRDKYINPLLLESSDYHSSENSYSFICFNPLATFKVQDHQVTQSFPDGSENSYQLDEPRNAIHALSSFTGSFDADDLGFKFLTNGLFGYMAYDAVRYYEDIDLPESTKDAPNAVPEIYYAVYKYVIVIDHFRNELYAFEHSSPDEQPSQDKGLESLVTLINNKNFASYHFHRKGEEISNFTDNEFLDIVQKGKDHCQRGDVFQMVLSRRFQSSFKGDDFNVYRALRSINPSPYLYYFDYGDYKIFGSSPESQLVIKDREAQILPIAGTFKRTGNDEADADLAKKLMEDPKENSEHVMLVDLARNDLSRHGSDVHVETFKEIQYYSHVIHMVSKVISNLAEEVDPMEVVADTFPAGTLSGAPKHMAMQLISKYEKGRRSYYGGAIGYIGFNGDFHHAIMIRSFLSRENTLFYQAGAGIVAKSEKESELQEVHNKLGALRHALDIAETI